MKTRFKTLALGLLLMTVASCEMHDPFDENTITGAVGPEAYWTVESAMMKAGESMGFVGQYYSTVAEIDHSEVWYELFEKEDKLVTASLIKAFTYSVTSNTTAQKRMLQTIQSYKHSEDMWNDSLHAYVLEDRFPVSYTLSPIAWVQPKDLNGFDKNLHAYFGENFAEEFKAGVTAKMNPTEDERNYGAYMNVLQGLSHLTDTIVTPNGDLMPYVQWITDSTFDANSATYKKHFKQYDSVFSTTNFDTIIEFDTVWNIKYDRNKIDPVTGKKGCNDTVLLRVEWNEETQKYDSIYWKNIKEIFILNPWLDHMEYVYDGIKERIDRVWNDSVSFMDLIQGADGYAIEYQKSYYINAELRVYDKNGTYSKTDSKQISIN